MLNFLSKRSLGGNKRCTLRFFSVSFIFLIMLFLPIMVFAQANTLDLGLDFAQGTGLTTTDIRVTIANIIRIALGLLGIIAVVIILYGGALWMFSQGDAQKIATAKKVIINAAIGLAIILSAFAITQFIMTSLQNAATGTGQQPSGPQIGGDGFGGGALGRSIRAHYPDRDQTDVARNTKMIITFNEKIDSDTIFDTTKSNAENLNINNVKIYKSSDATQGGSYPQDSLLINKVTVRTDDQLNYVFSFTDFLGSPSEDIKYSVYLTGGILKEDQTSVFGSATGSYAWEFTTGTTIDITPPKVENVSPENPAGCSTQDYSKCNPRNKIIQITFNEGVDPTSASGIVPGFTNIGMSQSVDGEYIITNQYRTIVFMPKEGCTDAQGVPVKENSCGDEVFCLPGNTEFEVTIQAGSAQSTFPYQGVVDLAGNSLDGQGGPLANTPPTSPNGTAEGSPTDDYAWSFITSNDVDLIPPKILLTLPNIDNSNVKLDQNIRVAFTKDILATSLFGSMQMFTGSLQSPLVRDLWAGAQSIYLGTNNSIVEWKHYDLLEGSTKLNTVMYYPAIYSTLKDDAQNCFNPSEGPTNPGQPKPKCIKAQPQDTQWSGGQKGYPNCDLTQ